MMRALQYAAGIGIMVISHAELELVGEGTMNEGFTLPNSPEDSARRGRYCYGTRDAAGGVYRYADPYCSCFHQGAVRIIREAKAAASR
jgi:dihydroorotase